MGTTYTVAVLTIGDEICIGQIVNTNAAWLASKVATLGGDVTAHSSIGDNREQMLAELTRLQKSADAVLITGGLGPTHDDITKSVLCEYFNDTLVEDKGTIENLTDLFEKRGRILTERNRAQALRPSQSTALLNPRGTAPGLLFNQNGKLLVAMPGVPMEMKGIMTEHVLPLISETIALGGFAVTTYSTLQTSGIPESSLADLLGNPDEFMEGNSLAFLPSTQGVRLRVSVIAATKQDGEKIAERITAHIIKKASRFIIGRGDETLVDCIHSRMIQTSSTLAIAESCTGGLLSSMITDMPGCSQYFMGGVMCYSNESKVRDVGIDNDIIQLYGAVSKEVAMQLAERVRLRFDTDYALSITGIAGPDGGSQEKPVGTVWIGIADRTGMVDAVKYIFGNDRRLNRERTCSQALLLLKQRMDSRNPNS